LQVEAEDDVVPQSAVSTIFQKTFPPIGEGCHYDIDRGYCTSEMLGPLTDIAKRYSVYNRPHEDEDAFYGYVLDLGTWPDDTHPDYLRMRSFRLTHFGSWRAAFLFRSGGYRYRCYGDATSRLYSIRDGGSVQKDFVGTFYRSPLDTVTRITVPQVSPYPYGQMDINNKFLSVVRVEGTAPPELANPVYIAARDDLQFGYPILPKGIPSGSA
jgi:hypothetical protein